MELTPERELAEQLDPEARQVVRDVLRVLEDANSPVRLAGVVIPANEAEGGPR